MKLSTIWSAYRKAEEFHEVYPALTQERQMDTFADALTRKIEALERPATQYCPRCEAKQRQIDVLNARIDSMIEKAIKDADKQGTISKQRYIQRLSAALRIAELESKLRAYSAWGAEAHVLVAEMVNMLTHEQVGRINGLRSWQETEPTVPQYVAMWDNKEVHHE